jgi:TDG/mug DNA glycosylase family protein
MQPLHGDLGLPPLPKYLQHDLCVLFVGFNPGERSAQIGHYYGYPGNRFWWLLWQSGLTDRLVPPEEDHTLPGHYGYGLTDIVERPSKSSGDLAAWELRSGKRALILELTQYQPRIASYNGKGVYTALTGKKKVEYGLQGEQVAPGVLDFVAASPSGRSREPLELKLSLYKQLRELTMKVCAGGTYTPSV